MLVRLVHGYNMVDCMRIKHYDVKLLADTRDGLQDGDLSLWRRDALVELGQRPNSQLPTPNAQRLTPNAPSAFPLPVQIWKLESSNSDRSVWITTMLKAADFAVTSVDTRDMAFPKVGTPDDPSWAPSGLKWSSLRHPIRNARLALRARWNASRADIWTFLRLRQPAWASDEMLTMVTEYRGPSIEEGNEEAVARHVLQAHAFMLNQFQHYWTQRAKGVER